MVQPRIFIGSSTAHLEVARAISRRLNDVADVTVWDEGVFRLNDGFLPRLVDVSSQYDFAVRVWAPDDVTESNGQRIASTRDNVIFESGLFMGALGPDHVFIAVDGKSLPRIPTDFAGITLAKYDGARMEKQPDAAVSSACDAIRAALLKVPRKDIQGQWRNRYVKFVDGSPTSVDEDIDVAAFADNVVFTVRRGGQGDVVFEARGRLDANRIRGKWQDLESSSGGPFLLILENGSDLMVGYACGFDPNGGRLFDGWVLAKWETDQGRRTEEEIAQRISRAEQILMQRTVGLPVMAAAAGQ